MTPRHPVVERTLQENLQNDVIYVITKWRVTDVNSTLNIYVITKWRKFYAQQ